MEDTLTQKLPSLREWNRSWGIDFAPHTRAAMEALDAHGLFVYVEFIVKNPNPTQVFRHYELLVIGRNPQLNSVKTIYPKMAFFTEDSIDTWIAEFVSQYESKVAEILNS